MLQNEFSRRRTKAPYAGESFGVRRPAAGWERRPGQL